MGELNHIIEALDHELTTTSLGRRASDKRKQQELFNLVRSLETAERSQQRADSHKTAVGRSRRVYSRVDILHATDLFFELLSSEDTSSKPIQRLLDFLQRPVEQSVMKTPSFFTDARHPARRIIGVLFAREKDILDKEQFETDPVYLAIYESIQSLVKEYKGDDRLFIKSYYEILNA